tara:strand:+ start:911 stop:1150 length:240 start_codon:yes stop_codon:yes gene_type:complete
MALEKKKTYDYEVRGQYKIIQERCKTSIEEDGEEISFSYHRKSYPPSTDVSAESDDIKALASALWTDDIKKAYTDRKKD